MIPRVTLSAMTSEDTDLIGNAASRIGTILHGKYRIDKLLGVGGMGFVYAATHRNGKRFAIKLLHSEFSSRRDIRTRFLREGYVANAVGHPGVVAVLDDDVADDGSAFLVMELLDGNTVDALGARPGSRMPLREVLGIAHQLLDVLDAAHTKTIVHRDVKPANLFVLTDGQLKVLDFGLARLRDATTGLNTTRTGETMGTPAFMPPEQARGDVSAIDPRTDIWAAGATIFTALSGRLVHEGENARQVLVRAATTPARSLSSVIPNAPASVVQLLSKALEFEKADRWDSAAAMREAVVRAHEELFGVLSREHLKSLFDDKQETTETAATEPSPYANSIPMLRDSAVVSASSSPSHETRPEPTTLPQANPTQERLGVRSGRPKILLIAGLLTILASIVVIALLRGGNRSANSVTAASTAIFAANPASSGPSAGSQDGLAPSLPPPTPSVSEEAQAPAAVNELPLVPSAIVSLGIRRPPAKTVAPSAPEIQSKPIDVTPPQAVASSVHGVATTADNIPPSDTNHQLAVSSRHRRIDDPVDHQ